MLRCGESIRSGDVEAPKEAGLEAELAEAQWRELPLEKGVHLRYRDLGAGPVLLLLHGFGCDGRTFAGLAERLQGRFRVIIPDQRGHGRSAACSFPPTEDATGPLEVLASDALRLIESLGAGPVVALGWSMGAAMLLAAIERCGAAAFSGLVIEDMAPRVSRSADWPLGLIGAGTPAETAAVAQRMRDDWPSVVTRMAPRVFAEEDSPLADDLKRSMLDSEPASMAPLWRALAAADYRKTCAVLNVPVLLTRGAQSRLYPAETMDWMAAQIATAECRTYQNSGHALHLEEPERFAADLAGFAEACAGR